MLTCDYAVEEARINLSEPEKRARLERFLEETRIVPTIIDGEMPSNVLLPEKDLPILFSALAARATHLLTGDKQHFGRHFGRKIRGMHILPPAEFFRQRTT